MRLRSTLLWQLLLVLCFFWYGIAFFGRQNKTAATDAIDAFVKDLKTVDGTGSDAALVMSALLKGLHESKMLADGNYDPKRHVAKFKIAGGGAVGDFLPEYRIWLRVLLEGKIQISWEKRKGGVRLRFSGLHFAPLPGATDLFVKAGLDDDTCPAINKVSQDEYYQCHLKKARWIRTQKALQKS